jgi:hypothetical protein
MVAVFIVALACVALEPFVARLHLCSPLPDASVPGVVLARTSVRSRL